ncbi:MAG: hypothetical protein ASARMPRED_005519 [Alectoria sarmentosa]|nr:MAG: hypothetical protein ASARMPRED_005519 [Alectoria sarmentosa]
MPSRLGDFFSIGEKRRARYSDWDIQEISRHLQENERQAWSQVPRLYTVLRTIGQLQVIDAVLDQGISDIWFPFNASSVPGALSSSMRKEFLEMQQLVLTKAVDLEKSELRPHAHFGKDEIFPFEVRERLGRGGFGTVDKIFSSFSRREFARKRFARGKTPESKRREVQNFKTELQVLKRIQHHHCVELIASYTDAKYFGLIMSPVADCNMADFYDRCAAEPEKLKLLRGFYGCLASGLSYLHSTKIRHRDIKPENILVKGSDVYLTDFGISLDWESFSRSTTTDDSGKTWIYCAPEVAYYQKRNSSSDVWSLGCVYLEMSTVLKRQSVDAMRQYFKSRSDNYRFYSNLSAIEEWLNVLAASGSELDRYPLEWTASMLRDKAEFRPSADVLCAKIINAKNRVRGEDVPFCGQCCAGEIDGDSTAESASDGDLWAENLDEEISSPPPTDDRVRPPSVRYDLSSSSAFEKLAVSNASSSLLPSSPSFPKENHPKGHQGATVDEDLKEKNMTGSSARSVSATTIESLPRKKVGSILHGEDLESAPPRFPVPATQEPAKLPEDAKEKDNGTIKGIKDVVDEAGKGVGTLEFDGVEHVAEDVVDNLLVDLLALKGFKVGEGGEILNADGQAVGETEEEHLLFLEDLIDKTVGNDGQVFDKDGDVIGRVTLPFDKARIKDRLSGVNVHDSLEVDEGEEMLRPDRMSLVATVEGDVKYNDDITMNKNGENLDEDEKVIYKAEVVVGDATDNSNEAGQEFSGNIAPPRLPVPEPVTQVPAKSQQTPQKPTAWRQALFDLNATSYLAFRQGDIISVVDIIDDWFVGDLRGCRGQVPLHCTRPCAELSQEEMESVAPPVAPVVTVTNVRAINDHRSAIDAELDFNKGDFISILDSSLETWWKGSLRGCTGYFPRDHVQVPNLSPKEGATQINTQAATFDSHDVNDAGKDGNAGNNRQNIQKWPSFTLHGRLPKIDALSWTKPASFLASVKGDGDFQRFLQFQVPECYQRMKDATIADVTMLIELLIRNGFDINSETYKDSLGFPPFCHILDWGGEEFEPLFSLMVEAGAVSDFELASGETAMTRAAAQGNLWAIKMLVDAGFQPNRRTLYTPLGVAAQHDQLETVQYLIKTIRVNPGFMSTNGSSALHVASKSGNHRIVRFLLENHPRLLRKQEESSPWAYRWPLETACRWGRLEVVRVLLAHGADANAYSIDSPLCWATGAGSAEMVQLLLDHGARVSGGSFGLVGFSPKRVTKDAEILRLLREGRRKQNARARIVS